MAEVRINKKPKSVEWSELNVSAIGDIFQWLLKNGCRTGRLEAWLVCIVRQVVDSKGTQ